MIVSCLTQSHFSVVVGCVDLIISYILLLCSELSWELGKLFCLQTLFPSFLEIIISLTGTVSTACCCQDGAALSRSDPLV